MKNFSVSELADIFSGRPVGTVEKCRYFSVLMPLVEKDGDTYVLFELRAKHMKTQPGEVCFPGGRIEPGEKAVDCAVREACEELGIFKEDIEVFCELDSSRNSAGSVIYRFMGQISYDALSRLELSKNEVEEVFLVPLSYFLENEPAVMRVNIGPTKDYKELSKAYGLDMYDWGESVSEVPVYNYGKYCIWGLTGRMMMNFVSILAQSEKA